MQRNFGPLKQQVEVWRAMQLSTASAKLLIYQAFIEEETGFPKHLARRVHDLYFQPLHEEFQPRTMWSLSNAFTTEVRPGGAILSSKCQKSVRFSSSLHALCRYWAVHWFC
jgi:hypothetical protein